MTTMLLCIFIPYMYTSFCIHLIISVPFQDYYTGLGLGFRQDFLLVLPPHPVSHCELILLFLPDPIYSSSVSVFFFCHAFLNPRHILPANFPALPYTTYLPKLYLFATFPPCLSPLPFFYLPPPPPPELVLPALQALWFVFLLLVSLSHCPPPPLSSSSLSHSHLHGRDEKEKGMEGLGQTGQVLALPFLPPVKRET